MRPTRAHFVALSGTLETNTFKYDSKPSVFRFIASVQAYRAGLPYAVAPKTCYLVYLAMQFYIIQDGTAPYMLYTGFGFEPWASVPFSC